MKNNLVKFIFSIFILFPFHLNAELIFEDNFPKDNFPNVQKDNFSIIKITFRILQKITYKAAGQPKDIPCGKNSPGQRPNGVSDPVRSCC